MDDFIKLFQQLAPHKNRYPVFQDFVTMSAISLYNSVYQDAEREAEYMRIVEQYSKADVTLFPQLLGLLINLLEPEPRDVLGDLYMALELGNHHTGQFFTPQIVSDLMAQINLAEQLNDMQDGFITVSDPACGAGSTLMSAVKMTINAGHNPMHKLWMQGIDIDRTVALMCFVQLTLWNTPAQICVGDSLALEIREVWHTPAHRLGL